MGFIYALLFIAALILILGWNPNMEAAAVVTTADKVIVQKNYQWLRNASFFTVPLFMLLATVFESLSNSSNAIHFHIWAAMLPLVLHLGLLRRLNTKSLYVYRHTQQALALVILRAGTAALALALGNQYAICLFLPLNGFLWLQGGNWGFRQLKKNTCWLMERKHEKIVVADDVVLEDQKKTAPQLVIEKPHAPALVVADTKMAQAYLDEGNRLYIDGNDKIGVTKNMLLAFQFGSLEIRRRAVAVLDKLGEVEQF